MLRSLRQHARALRTESCVLYLVARHPHTPWYARAFVAAVAAYALSPIDLIPDFVPVLGYLDDIVLVPLGIALAMKMVPGPVLSECRERAQALAACRNLSSRTAAAVIVALWLVVAALCAAWVVQKLHR